MKARIHISQYMTAGILFMFIWSSFTSFLWAQNVTVEPMSYDYGDAVELAQIVSASFKVSNNGSSDLTVYAAKLLGADLSHFWLGAPTGWPIVIPAGESQNIPVTFAPLSSGTKNATLRIVTSEKSENPIDIPLTGNSIAKSSKGYITAGPVVSNENPVPGDQITVSIGVDLTPALAPCDTLLSYIATLTWDPDVLQYYSRQGGTAPWDSPDAVGDRRRDKGFIEWYDHSGSGASGSFYIIHFVFDVVGPVGSQTLLDLEITSFEGTIVEYLDEMLVTVDATVEVTSNINAPEISVTPTSHDFGWVYTGASSSYTFVVRNEGLQDLTVNSTNLTGTDSDQFSISAGGAPFTLSSGETQDVVVDFSPSSATSKSATLQVVSNDSDEDTVDIALSGTGSADPVPDIDANYTSYNYGRVGTGETESQTFIITNQGSADLHVSGTTLTGSNPSHFNIVSGGGAFTLSPSQSHNIVVNFAPTSTAPKSATLQIANDDPDEDPYNIALSGTPFSFANTTFNKTSHNFGNVTAGSKILQSFILTNTGTSGLFINGYGMEGRHGNQFWFPSGFSLDIFLFPGQSRQFDVYFVPTSSGVKEATFLVITSDPDPTAFRIPLTGTGVEIADIDVEPTSLDYDTVLVGQDSSQVVTVYNIGIADLSVSQTSITGSHNNQYNYNNNPSSFSLGFGEKKEINLKFAPNSEGQKSATFRVDSNDPDENPFNVSLTGYGLQDDNSLPVQLAVFNAEVENGQIIINWVTESEINNLGFELYRAMEKDGGYTLLSSYEENFEMAGQGNSNLRHEYQYIDKSITPENTYWYKLADVDFNGVRTFHGPISVTVPVFAQIPGSFHLYHNFPNPFNPRTVIKFDIPSSSSGAVPAKIQIYNSLGQVVNILKDEKFEAGSYQIEWDGTSSDGNVLPSGVYYAIFTAGNFSESIKMILLK